MDNLNARRLRQKFWISNTALGTGSINLLERSISKRCAAMRQM
jgi:hypothetical protein